MSSHPGEKHAMNRPVALVTGASSGFGLLTCLQFAACGYQVAAAMRDLSKQTQLTDEAARMGVLSSIAVFEMDVTKQEQIDQAVRQVQETYGRIDVLVNNAGYALGGFVEQVPLAEWRRQMDTNFFGVVAVTQAVLPIMRSRRSGTIINVSSVSGRIAFPGYAPYSSSKHAVEGFSESLRLEVLSHGIRVVLVEPGSYKTAIWQKGFDQIDSESESPYRNRLRSMLQHSRQAAEQAADPSAVAKLIVHIAQKKRPKLRYPIGRDARLGLFGKAVLPWSWFERIVNMNLKE